MIAAGLVNETTKIDAGGVKKMTRLSPSQLGTDLERGLRLCSRITLYSLTAFLLYMFIGSPLTVFFKIPINGPFLWPAIVLFFIFVATLIPGILWWKLGSKFARSVLDREIEQL